MKSRRSAAEASRARIESAARAAGRTPARFGGIDTDFVLHLERARVVPLPEPVVVPDMVNGRRLVPWEMGLYVEWAHRERRAELVLFAGLIG